DVAVIPGADYSNQETPFYSSREADTLGQYGGIAVWTGGTQTTPINYAGLRATDVSSDLAWLWWTPYGITCDREGILYACGTDTTRRWVKSYSIFGNFAVEKDELPSLNSTSSPDQDGAPMEAPTDIALSPDEQWAYVIDMDAQRAFVFHNGPVSVDHSDLTPVNDYMLLANYPNPFNPETVISYQIPVAGHVEVSVYNIVGEKVATLVNTIQTAGHHEIRFTAQDLSSGIYFYVMRSQNFSAIRKMTLIK
ncbi:MAG: T9SS type A sorting domain-containing protein, partial [Calditrichales bacterium]